MSKRKKEDAPAPGAPAWMATYGDLMTLLLCFFVLLFSMSSVDAQKFELIAASFSKTFSIFSAGSTAIGDGMLVSNGVSQLNELDDYINSMGKTADGDQETNDILSEAELEQLAKAEELAEKIAEAIAEENLDEVEISFTSQYVLLTLNGALLFDSGKAELKEGSLPIMKQVGKILERYAENAIEVEGHTDNVPMRNGSFLSNDVLSNFRALEVFYFLIENTKLDPADIKHSGRGEYAPIAENSTPAGRAMNRRVEIKIYHALSSY